MKLFKLKQEFLDNFTERAIDQFNLRVFQTFGDWYSDGFKPEALVEVGEPKGLRLEDGLLCVDGVWRVITEDQLNSIEELLNRK